MTQLNRGFVADMEIRSDGEGRTIHGIVVPFGVTARVRDAGGPAYDEAFQQGAFTKTLAERRSPVKLLWQHDSSAPLGRMVDHREEPVGLYGAFKISDTPLGNEKLELARDGVLDSFSVGFSPVKHVKRGGVTVRTEVAMRETSMVTFPAYADALVSGIRSLEADLHEPLIEAALATDAAPALRAMVQHLLAVAEPQFDTTPLTSLDERLRAVVPGDAGTPDVGAASDEPPTPGHSGRLHLPNSFRLALRERGLLSPLEKS